VQGAEILSFQIFDNERRLVNVLKLGEEYQFEVSGRFTEDADNVYLGMHIRTVSGTMVTGQRYPESGRFIKQVHAGKSFRITYGFKMSLIPGVYFVGGGVWSQSGTLCLHRIMDAIMFRVSRDKKLNAIGYADLSTAEPSLEIL
jgi:lipopolysaccharide transport system ATP-binding protein